MKALTPFFFATAALAVAVSSRAVIITEPTRTFTVGSPSGDIPDNQDPGPHFDEVVSGSSILSLTKVVVGLNLVGTTTDSGWAGDMIVYLNQAGGPSSILLNRVGTVNVGDAGYFYDGWDVTLSDDATQDIHGVDTGSGSGVLMGSYQPDGRVFSPEDAALRDGMLEVFFGRPADGTWRLFVADLAPGAGMTLQSWSLTFTGETELVSSEVPEASTWAGGGLVAMLAGGWAWARRRR